MNPSQENTALKVLLIESRTGWTAVGIDHNFLAQGKSLIEVVRNFKSAVSDTIETYKAENLDWREHVGPASETIQELFKTSIQVSFQDLVVRHLVGEDNITDVEARLAESGDIKKELCPA